MWFSTNPQTLNFMYQSLNANIKFHCILTYTTDYFHKDNIFATYSL